MHMYKFAIIGCGRIAHRHAENIQKVGELIAVCDIDSKKADEFANKYNTKAYHSIEDLLQNEKEADIISVCTPNGLHAEHSIKSLQAGKHVLCEKPMCITGAAAWQIIETEKFSRKKMFVVKSARFNPLLKQVFQLISDKKLGSIYSFQLSCFWNRPEEYFNDWHGKMFPDGGTLYTQFSHYIDTIYWLFGDLDTVAGYAANSAHKDSIEFEDTGVAALKMKSGILGTMNWSINTYKKNSEIALTVIAEKGTISLGGEYLNELRYQQLEEPIIIREEKKGPNDYIHYKGTMSHHKEVYENLILALEDKHHPFTNTYDGMKTVEMIEKIYKVVL
jgi:UDP-N-acetyl-2-amino-2-deoxyglucuronate dehydrogenase